MTPEETLTPTEARLVAAIADDPGATQADIARALKKSARHVRRLMARERVRKALDAVARAGLDAGASILGRGATRAAQSLLAMATGQTKASAPRVAACRAVIDGAGRLIDLVDLERRIGDMERASQVQVPAGGWGRTQ